MLHSNAPPVKKRDPLTTRSSILRCVSAAEHHQGLGTALKNSTPKHAGQNAESISQEEICHVMLARTSSIYAKSLRSSLETERRYSQKSSWKQMSLPIIFPLDSVSAAPTIVNGDGWGRVVRDLKTIIVLVLLAFNFTPQRSHYSPTRPRLQFSDAATVTLTAGMAYQITKWSHWHNRSSYSPECKKTRRCTGGTITDTKH